MEDFKWIERDFVVPEPVLNDLIEFTPEAMEKLYHIFGATEKELQAYHDDFHKKCMHLITKDNCYTDDIEGLSCLGAIGQVFNKASFSTGIEGLNMPRNLLPNKYLVNKVSLGGIYIRPIVKDRFFPVKYREMWENFKRVIPTIEFKRPEHQYYVLGCAEF